MPTLLRRIVAHWPLKLASLALAVLLWALVSAEQVTMHWIPVAVEAEVRDPRFVLTEGPGPGEVRVLFAGPGRVLWQLALDRPTLVLPVRDAAQSGYALESDMIRFPEGVRGVAVRDIRPAVVRLQVQPVATREIALQPRFARASLAQWVVRGTPIVVPASVRVTGPAEELGRIRFLETEAIQLTSGDSAEFDVRARVDTSGLREFNVAPIDVRVRGDLDLRAERILAGVPVIGATGSRPMVADVRVSGPSRRLEALDVSEVRVEEMEAGSRILGLPASIQAQVIGRRAAPDTLQP